MSAIPNLARTRGVHFLTNPPLASKLGEIDQARILRMFRSGLDTHEIASKLQCTPAAAANGLATARERERGP